MPADVPSHVHNQRRLLLDLLATLRPHWRRDRNLPARINAWLAARRAGSRDRRLYRELGYTALRILPWIETVGEDLAVARIAASARPDPATGAFIDAFADPAALVGLDRAHLLPEWLHPECPAAFAPAELDALLARAPLWLRLQTSDPAAVAREFEERGWVTHPSAVLPQAWRVTSEADVTTSDAWRRGAIEVQDLGSQLLLEMVAPPAGGHWLDACAGAGGKSLQLARLLGPSGHVTASDIRPQALDELRERARRAGIDHITIAPAVSGTFDGVLVDAPCSGSGTWRRAPHLKWITTPTDIAHAAALQTRLLTEHAPRVRPGGLLVYATCSLCRSENEEVAAAFLRAHPHFSPGSPARNFGYRAAAPGLALLPARHDTDGFYVATFVRAA